MIIANIKLKKKWLDTGTSIKSGGVKLHVVKWPNISSVEIKWLWSCTCFSHASKIETPIHDWSMNITFIDISKEYSSSTHFCGSFRFLQKMQTVQYIYTTRHCTHYIDPFPIWIYMYIYVCILGYELFSLLKTILWLWNEEQQ